VRTTNALSVDLIGGLGNQLFCYAAGNYVATKLDVPLICVMTASQNSIVRDENILSRLFLPARFIVQNLESEGDSRRLRFFGRLRRKNRKLFSKFKNPGHYYSNTVGFDYNLELLSRPVHLHGYFQSWKYAISSREILLESLRQNIMLSPSGQMLATQIANESGFIVHIRLGDYLDQKNKYFGTLSSEYYRNVIKKLDTKKHNVFVFSDDVRLAQERYADSFPANTEWVGEESEMSDLETLLLMSMGAGIAIANSTFSWWAAFLSDQSGLIIAPSKWFQLKADPTDIIPPSWAREESVWQ
jgi:hypothetical protein